ncbi:MOSC domain-containing protein [uncultured Nevskia sp.]|uniref:MOSC domain-containing protein n=1 Tax=uncultured Nevskia sp. TaxID=228950 RepID=UPI0025ED15EB|nr:MOSC domain-containing protein [uncultured Nevskia sp.]
MALISTGNCAGTITGLFAGRVQAMPGDGRPTAIFKQPVIGAMAVGLEGLVGDAQADRRVHGGPEKALHHFPLETHARLAALFPEAAATLVAGALGENISTSGIEEKHVCIGDVFALGSVRVQLCQPRTPCWKIEARHGVDGMTRAVADAGIAGWYYRVLEPGTVAVGDRFELIDRVAGAPTLVRFWEIVHAHRPPLADLEALRDAPGLASNWQRKLADRVDWLRRN